MATTDIPRLEMLQVADMVAREKGIEREEVLEAMEQAIQKAGRAKYGLEHDIRAEIDRKTGEIKLLRYMQVADPIENENTQVSVVEAQRRNPEAQVGDFLTDELPPIACGRVAAQAAKQLFTQEVPEIYDNIIEIKAVARDPGSRAKIAVLSHDSSIDPIGACVGMRGSRVQAVVQELQGEKVDIIPWSADTANFIVNALAP